MIIRESQLDPGKGVKPPYELGTEGPHYPMAREMFYKEVLLNKFGSIKGKRNVKRVNHRRITCEGEDDSESLLGKIILSRRPSGHIKDLPEGELGVDLEKEFQPEYVSIPGKAKVLRELKKASKGVKSIYLGPDPDREGEAIAWHIAEEIGDEDKTIYRVLFNEITQKAVLDALRHPGKLQQAKYEAQQARRILDRLVGYQVSPLLWEKVRRGLSAGRVQSVAVRIICEREREIQDFCL